jgi:hypothetical protein
MPPSASKALGPPPRPQPPPALLTPPPPPPPPPPIQKAYGRELTEAYEWLSKYRASRKEAELHQVGGAGGGLVVNHPHHQPLLSRTTQAKSPQPTPGVGPSPPRVDAPPLDPPPNNPKLNPPKLNAPDHPTPP